MKTRELIDKYEVRQSTDTDYNPPSYIWIDNTGEIIRCMDCVFHKYAYCDMWNRRTEDYGYCYCAERKEPNTHE